MCATRGMERVVVTFLLAMTLVGCFWDRESEEEVTVFAASSLNGSLQEIGRLFEETTGREIAFNFAGSNVLAQQIVASGGADIYFSADDRWMNFLEREGKIHSETRRDLLTNSLVAICAEDAEWNPVPNLSELAELDFNVLCVGDPDAVPAGRYARDWLSRGIRNGSSIWDELKDRLSPATDAKAALAQALSRKDAVGIVYLTDYLDRKDEARLLLRSEALEARYPHCPNASGHGQATGRSVFSLSSVGYSSRCISRVRVWSSNDARV